MKRLLPLILILSLGLTGCAATATSMWRESAEKNCTQESMPNRREACRTWVDQKAWDMDRERWQKRD